MLYEVITPAVRHMVDPEDRGVVDHDPADVDPVDGVHRLPEIVRVDPRLQSYNFV